MICLFFVGLAINIAANIIKQMAMPSFKQICSLNTKIPTTIPVIGSKVLSMEALIEPISSAPHWNNLSPKAVANSPSKKNDDTTIGEPVNLKLLVTRVIIKIMIKELNDTQKDNTVKSISFNLLFSSKTIYVA